MLLSLIDLAVHFDLGLLKYLEIRSKKAKRKHASSFTVVVVWFTPDSMFIWHRC